MVIKMVLRDAGTQIDTASIYVFKNWKFYKIELIIKIAGFFFYTVNNK